jgi:hypothetical protein
MDRGRVGDEGDHAHLGGRRAGTRERDGDQHRFDFAVAPASEATVRNWQARPGPRC